MTPSTPGPVIPVHCHLPVTPSPQFPIPVSHLPNRVDHAVELLRSLHTRRPIVAFSGGKDSQVVAHLCRRAGLEPELIYHVTTIDPPEVVRHARQAGAWFDHPKANFARFIVQHGLPTMWQRWCCRLFKHSRTFAEITILGVRAAESYRRKRSWTQELQPTKRTLMVLPVLHWTDAEVWQYVTENRLKLCCLYSEGYARVGCIGCPLVRGSRLRDYPRWPRFAQNIASGFAQYAERTKLKDPGNYWRRWIHDLFERPNHHAQCSDLAVWANT